MKRFILFVFSILLALGIGACTPVQPPNEGSVEDLRAEYVSELKQKVDVYRASSVSSYKLDVYGAKEHNLLLDEIFSLYEQKILTKTQESEMQELVNSARIEAISAGYVVRDREKGCVELSFVAEEYSLLFSKLPPFNGDFHAEVLTAEEGYTFSFVSKGYYSLGVNPYGPHEFSSSIGAFNPDEIKENDYVGVIVKKDGKITGYSVTEGLYEGRNFLPRYKSVNFDLEDWQEVSEEQVLDLMEKFMLGVDGEAQLEIKAKPNVVQRKVKSPSLGYVTVTEGNDGQVSVDFSGINEGVTLNVVADEPIKINGQLVTSGTIERGDGMVVLTPTEDRLGVFASVYSEENTEIGVFGLVVWKTGEGSSMRLTSRHALIGNDPDPLKERMKLSSLRWVLEN